MSMASKVETATLEDADWSFTSSPAVMKCIRNAAIKASREFEMVEFEDAQQDALLWLSVRPEMVAKAHKSEDYTQLTQDIYTNALRVPAVRESNFNSNVIWLDGIDRNAEES